MQNRSCSRSAPGEWARQPLVFRFNGSSIDHTVPLWMLLSSGYIRNRYWRGDGFHFAWIVIWGETQRVHHLPLSSRPDGSNNHWHPNMDAAGMNLGLRYLKLGLTSVTGMDIHVHQRCSILY